MTSNEIYNALLSGSQVYWSNTGYKVFLDNNDLYTIFERNSYMCKLQPSEYKDCFIKDSSNAQD